jgi:hypothetical protein
LRRPVLRAARLLAAGSLAAAITLVGPPELGTHLAHAAPAAADGSGELAGIVIDLLRDKDKDIRALGLEQVRSEAKGTAATRKFAELLPTLSSEAQVGLLGALADRGDRAAAEAVRNLLSGAKEAQVRVAALRAMGSLGAAADVATLVKSLADGPDAERKAARASLTRLAGDDVPQAILGEMKNARTAARIAMIEILAARRARDTIPELLDSAVASDEKERAAAMIALGQLAEPTHVAAMLTAVAHAKAGAERNAAEKAVAAVCMRTKDAAQRAAPILAAMENKSLEDIKLILPALGRVGGPEAVKEVDGALAAAELHAAAARALCNWPDASVADRLLTMHASDAHAEHQTMALGALIRVAPLPDGRADADRLKLVKQVMALCKTDEERKLVLQRARAIRTVETLDFVLPYVDQPVFLETVCETIVELAHHRVLREAHKDKFFPALDRIMKISKNATTVERARRYKNNQTWTKPAAAEKE